MSTNNVTAHDLGRAGRPPSPETRKQRLRAEFIATIGADNLTPSRIEGIRAAVEWSAMAAEARAKLMKSGSSSPEDTAHVGRLEELAAQAVARLNLPAPTATNTRAVA
jgi:hypothetical protein